MSAPEPLFDAAEAGIVPVPAARRTVPLYERQADKIRAGLHPLSGVGERPERIPLAPAGTGTCGTCAHKARPHHHRRAYPKCDVGAVRVPDGAGYREVWPRCAHSEATDLRSGWPACRDYEPRDGAA
ncbi:hypothetical protein [Glycomyces arizonensis]|uniref:hypothetical protein n=1 Tax=Glycomyces arizonensis TaxID=256035 RepID=UPI00040B5BCF|nr:hypothetical protein [Glycomyces arizonensis]